MGMKATDPRLERVGSHWVSNRGSRLEKEELFPVLAATWRGEQVAVEMEASRYVTSDGNWTDWRVFTRSNGMTDTARRALNEACTPVVEAWLASPAYADSRAEAFASMIRREFRDEKYSADRPAQVLARYANELTVADRERFGEAVAVLRRYLELVG